MKQFSSQLITAPVSNDFFLEGIRTLVNSIRPTLGPIHRLVALQDRRYQEVPEILDDGGLIARRILALKDRYQNCGAMFLRHILWKLREEIGDGTATTAVMFEYIYSAGRKYLIAGVDQHLLCQALENRLKIILEYFDNTLVQYDSLPRRDSIFRVLCSDEQLVHHLVEIFNVIEDKGFVEVIRTEGESDEHEFIQGSFWNAPLFSSQLLFDPWSLRSEIRDGGLLVTNFDIKDVTEVVELLPKVEKLFPNGFCIVARNLDEIILNLFSRINRLSNKFNVIAVKTPGKSKLEQFNNLQDIAIITGAELLLEESGASLRDVKDKDFGSARKIWADQENFGVIHGKGNVPKIRSHLKSLHQSLNDLDDSEVYLKLRRRIGNLHGGVVRLKVGGYTSLEKELRLQKAEKAVRILPHIKNGWVAGGGISLIECSRALYKITESVPKTEVDEIADKILTTALLQPALTILFNAGYPMATYPSNLHYPIGIDAQDGNQKDFITAGIIDAAAMVRAAIIAAIKGATLALTVGTIFYPKTPRLTLKP